MQDKRRAMGKKEYAYRAGEPEKWSDYRKDLRIIGYSWALRCDIERQRRHRKVLRRIRTALLIALIIFLLWLSRHNPF